MCLVWYANYLSSCLQKKPSSCQNAVVCLHSLFLLLFIKNKRNWTEGPGSMFFHRQTITYTKIEKMTIWKPHSLNVSLKPMYRFKMSNELTVCEFGTTPLEPTGPVIWQYIRADQGNSLLHWCLWPSKHMRRYTYSSKNHIAKRSSFVTNGAMVPLLFVGYIKFH